MFDYSSPATMRRPIPNLKISAAERQSRTRPRLRRITSSWYREEGNDCYRNVTVGLSPVLQMSRLETAMFHYKLAFEIALNDADRASATKNMAMVYWKMAVVSRKMGEKWIKTSALFKDALKKVQAAMHYGKNCGWEGAWCEELRTSAVKCWQDVLDSMKAWDYEDRIAQMEILLPHLIDCPVKGEQFLDVASFYHNKSVIKMRDRDYRQCLNLLGKAYYPLHEALRLAPEWSDQEVECMCLEQLIIHNENMAVSMQTREQGEELLDVLMKAGDKASMDLAWHVVDMFRHSALLACDYDLELEAMALSSLGKVYDKVFKMKDRAKACLIKCLELVHGMVPRKFAGSDWFDYARRTLASYQAEQRRREKMEEDKRKAAHLNMIRGELRALKMKKVDLSKAGFLRHVYAMYPPINPLHTLAEISAQPEVSELKRLYQKAIIHYHPDKVNEEVHGMKWKVLTEEITKLLTQTYEYYKGYSTA